MRRMTGWMTAALVAAATLAAPAVAQTIESRPAAASMDPALRQALTGVATALLAGFAASMATGSEGGFDPGPILEKSLRAALAGNHLDNAVDALLASALRSEGAAGMPAELRAALVLAARAMVVGAKREVLRDLGGAARP
jgi:FtsH-binding integral membrane protein